MSSPLMHSVSTSPSPSIFTQHTGIPTTPVYDTYWHFAAERLRIYYKRLAGHPTPWTDDPILRTYKFTNTYRACDRVSQFLIKNVIYQGDQSPDELFFRIILFKIFNRIETRQYLLTALGSITRRDYRTCLISCLA